MSQTRRVRSAVALPEAATLDINRLLDMSQELSRLIEASKGRSPSTQPFTLLDDLAEEVKLDSTVVRQIFTALENLRSLRETYENTDGAIERIKEGVPDELASRVQDQRADLASAIELYEQDNPVSLSFKARRIAFRHERLFHDVEIITDARPVFNHAAEVIVEFVISHEMSIEVLKENDFETIFFALDNSDLLKLRSACDRAIVKSRTLKNALKDHNPEILRDEDA